jgi:hypothetical protein
MSACDTKEKSAGHIISKGCGEAAVLRTGVLCRLGLLLGSGVVGC